MAVAKISRFRMLCFNLLTFAVVSASGQAFAWTMSSNFESGNVGSIANGSSGFTYSGQATLYASEHANSGSKSAKMNWVRDQGGAGVDGYGWDHGEYDYAAVGNGGGIWVRGYFYFPSAAKDGYDFNFTASPVCKFLRVRTSAGGFDSVFFNTDSTGQGKLVLSNEPAGYQMDIPNSYMSRGVWHCVELYVKLSTSSPVMRVWLDGKLVAEDLSHATMNSSGGYSDQVLIMTQWNGDTPRTQTQWMDDIVVTSDTPANKDANGNPMIGLLSGSTTSTTVAAPAGLKAVSMTP